MVHVPAGTNDTSSSVRCGRRSRPARLQASAARPSRTPRLVTATFAGADPFRPEAGASGAWVPRRTASATSASSVSEIVSTIASSLSPFSRVATICVVITLKPPPKMYGALKEPSEVMNVSSAAPPMAG